MRKKSRFIKVHAHSFYTLFRALKEAENSSTPIKIKNVPASKFLLKASNFETSNVYLPYEVKLAILNTYGVQNPDPAKLKDEKSMNDFNFNDIQNISLTRKFNKIALSHNPDAKTITVDSVINCNKVIDCVNLVAAAASILKNQTFLL